MLEMYPADAPTQSTKSSDQPSSLNFHLRGNKIYFISLGCPRNLTDTEVMLGILLKAGFEVSPELEAADFIIINTCGFLEESREESLDTIHECLQEKKETAKLIVAGCMVSKHRHLIEEEFPEVDCYIGPGDVQSILKAVCSEEKGVFQGSSKSYIEMGEVPRQLSTPSHYAYLKIAEGCRKRCAYCIIPDIKGPLKSKPMEQIVKEFKALLASGVKEIILIAQDLGDWGKDLKMGKNGLSSLLKTLLEIDQQFWLRLLYVYPDEIDDELIAIMKQDPRVCPYLDMPLQHINDEMLKAMRRKVSRADILKTLKNLREQIPNIHIRTSLIVGFPGETEKQFNELYDFVKEAKIEHLGVFKFSKEEGSHAATLPDQIPDAIKQERLDKIMKLQQKVLEKKTRQLIGKRLPVIVESYHPESKHLMLARHQGQCPEIDSQVIINDTRGVKAFGQVYEAEITDVLDYDLLASIN